MTNFLIADHTKNNKVTVSHPQICEFFLAHCKQGNSTRSFIKYLFGQDKAYSWLIHNNKEFREISFKFKKPIRKIYA